MIFLGDISWFTLLFRSDNDTYMQCAFSVRTHFVVVVDPEASKTSIKENQPKKKNSQSANENVAIEWC